ncbi:MAG: L,D-transpeptidase family protein [Sphingomonadaceae bacterium]
MAKRRWSFLKSPALLWPIALLLAGLDAAGLYHLANGYAADAARDAQLSAARLKAAQTPPVPKPPPPPAMITPPSVEAMLRQGTLIVISKKSQNMFVFSDGALWATTPISTGKRRHETPSGVFPILQKHKLHRSNIYSGAPMPYMQRLTWSGIALHAGYVPGYPASHGCIRIPRAMAQSLFKLTTASETTVVIGDAPLETERHAQQFALTAQLPVHSALAPPSVPPPAPKPAVVLASAAPAQPRPMLPAVSPPAALPPIAPMPAPPVAAPATVPQAAGGQTIQLTAAPSPAEAEAHWARMLITRPDLSRFQKSVMPAVVNARLVYRLRVSGADAHNYCEALKRDGISCLTVR